MWLGRGWKNLEIDAERLRVEFAFWIDSEGPRDARNVEDVADHALIFGLGEAIQTTGEDATILLEAECGRVQRFQGDRDLEPVLHQQTELGVVQRRMLDHLRKTKVRMILVEAMGDHFSGQLAGARKLIDHSECKTD